MNLKDCCRKLEDNADRNSVKAYQRGPEILKKLGQWDYFGEPIGDFNTEYAYRALVALAGLGANTVEAALYPKIEQDADGNTLLNFL